MAARGLLRRDRLGGAGRAGGFNVAIRTLALYPGGEAVLNVGGGVVADSTADGGVRGGPVESALRRSAPADLTLIETFRWEPGAGFVRLPAHLARMARGAAALGVGFDRGGGRAGCWRRSAGAAPLRVRLTLALDGEVGGGGDAARAGEAGSGAWGWRRRGFGRTIRGCG